MDVLKDGQYSFEGEQNIFYANAYIKTEPDDDFPEIVSASSVKEEDGFQCDVCVGFPVTEEMQNGINVNLEKTSHENFTVVKEEVTSEGHAEVIEGEDDDFPEVISASSVKEEDGFQCDICVGLPVTVEIQNGINVNLEETSLENFTVVKEEVTFGDSSPEGDADVIEGEGMDEPLSCGEMRKGDPRGYSERDSLKPFKCNLCPFTTSWSGNLKIHTRNHSGERPYKCNYCQSTFNKKSSLKIHFRMHTGEKPYKCDLCQFAASRKNDLNRHTRIHSGEKPYKCNLCLYAFSDRRNLKSHLMTHSGEKPYQCNLCQYAFTRKNDLKRHMKIHSGERPYKCDLCEYACIRKSDLKRHTRIHSGEKPYKCDLCEYACSYRRQIKRHLNAHSCF